MFEPILINNQEKQKTTINEILKLRIFPTDIIPVPEIILSFEDCMVMTRKNVSCITGKAKVGKTFLLTLLTQIILKKGDINNFLKSYLPKDRDKIIYIDTEQSDYHILLILKRIKDFVGENNIHNLYMFNFDAIDIDQRREYTKELIYGIEGVGLVIIDGIADLIYDTNDIKESSILASDLRKWSVERDIHITNVLHQNPSENSKMKGHLGTILSNKSETVIQISNDRDNSEIKIVDTLFTRNKKPQSFAFEIDQNGIPYISDYEISQKQEKKMTKKELFEYYKFEILTDIFINYTDIGMGYGQLLDHFKRSFLNKTTETIGEMYAKSYIKDLIETSYIIKNETDNKYLLTNKINDENSIF